MGDGTYTGAGLKLCTDSFSSEDLDILIAALNKKWNLNVTKQIQNREKNHYRLYISKAQLPIVIELVRPYLLPEFQYKLGMN